MTIPLPLATDLAAERANELTAAATNHRLARDGRLSRLSRRAKRAQPVAERPTSLRSAA